MHKMVSCEGEEPLIIESIALFTFKSLLEARALNSPKGVLDGRGMPSKKNLMKNVVHRHYRVQRD